MATRTAPTVNGTPGFLELSVGVIDHTGDTRTDTYVIPAGTTNADIEAFIAAQQAISNASIHSVKVSSSYYSPADSSNADEVVWENARTNLVFLFKNNMKQSFNYFIPAPVNTIFIENTTEIDPTSIPLIDYLSAADSVAGSGWEIVSARLTHRKQMNKAVKI